MRTFEYRLYPNRTQRQQLMACLKDARGLYNEMLAATKEHYAESRQGYCPLHVATVP